jgi:hypothetical protein
MTQIPMAKDHLSINKKFDQLMLADEINTKYV